MTTAAGDTNQLIERTIRAARLEDGVYDEVARDPLATTQALVVVVASAILGGIGSLNEGAGGLIGGLLFAPLVWVLGSWLAYLVGTRVMNAGSVTWLEVARALGFAQAPGLLGFLTIIPILGALVGLVIFIWTLATGVVALRAALRVTTGQAIGTLVLSWLLAFVLVVVVFALVFGTALVATM